jgi:hypothetical protein
MMEQLTYKILDREITYTGRELRSGWVAGRTGLSGQAAAAFIGPCRVATEDLVDLEDARAGATIYSPRMAHLIIELPDCPLQVAVLRQHLLVCSLAEILLAADVIPRREGDDIYVQDRKLTVSIAAPYGGGSLIHLGINVDAAGAPVPAIGLEDLDVDPVVLLGDLLARFQAELKSCRQAETKVRTVS